MLTPTRSRGGEASAGSAARANEDTRTDRKPMLMDMPIPLSEDSSARPSGPSSGVDRRRGARLGCTVNPHQGEPMNRYLPLVSMAALPAVSPAGMALAEEKVAAKAVVMPASDLKWIDSPVLKGAKMAVLWGDPAKGAYGALRSVPAGSGLGLHSHTHSQNVVGVSGTIEFNFEG